MIKKDKQGIQFKNKYSIAFIVKVFFIIIIMLQSLMLYMNFRLLGTDKKLEKNTYSYMLKKVDEKSRELERTMTDSWSNHSYMQQVLSSAEQKYEEYKKEGKPMFCDEEMVNGMIDMINSMRVSGAFIIFDAQKEEGPKSAIYLRDLNVNVKMNDKSDIIMRAGDDKIAKNMKIALASDWERNFDSRIEKNRQMYEKALKLMQRYDPKEPNSFLGFWETDREAFGENTGNIYFMLPLFDKNTMRAYGLLGIEVSDTLIENMLRYKELSDSEKDAYILVKDKQAPDEFDVIAMKGPYVKSMIKDGTISVTRINNEYYDENMSIKDNRYLLGLNLGQKKNLIAIQRPIRLYKKNIYKNKDQWYLFAVIDKNEIYVNSKELRDTIIKTILIAIIVSVFLGYILSLVITYPIKTISNRIKNLSLDEENIKIKKINIVEFDNLITVIEDLSKRLSKNSKKFQSIIDSSSIPIIVVEQDESKGVVYKLGQVSRILPEYVEDEKFEEVISMEDFRRKLQNIMQDTKIVESIYDAEKDQKVDIWLKIYRGQTYYIKVVTKKTVTYEDEDNSNEMEPRLLEIQIVMDSTREITERNRMKKERDYDMMTGLLNRISFKERVTNYIKKDPNHKKKAAMVMWDLDDLKYVNDTYGHDYGDMYLKNAGKIIGMLKMHNAFISRVSGDEFFGFIEYDGDKKELLELLEQTKNNLLNTELVITDKEKIKVRATTGLSWYPDDAQNYDMLMKFADFAMYTAKHTSKGIIKQFENEQYEKNYLLLSGKEDLNKLIEKREVRFAFQPIVNVKTAEIFAYEALMRPTSKEITTVFDVMRLAKEQSKLTAIETLTWEGVLYYMKQHFSELNGKKIFINSIANERLPEEKLVEIKEAYSDILGNIVIEIIEQEEVEAECMKVKQEFKKEFGSKIAIDDFGSGYATESWLLQFFPDFVKIDMSIIRNIDTDESRQAIVKNILSYTQNRGIKVICEGVETYEEMKKVVELGADLIQGYYFAKPNFEFKEIDQKAKQTLLDLIKK